MARPRSEFLIPAAALPRVDSTMADTMYDRIEDHIKNAESELEDGEVLVVLHYLPNGEALQVLTVGYHNPYLLKFYCEDGDGNSCDVLVHHQNAHLVLRRIRPTTPRERHPIGFVAEG